MKNLFKNIVILLLKLKVNKLIKKSNTEIYGITGSVGKTSTKKIISEVLKTKYSVCESIGGFNTRIGILLSILGEKESGFSSLTKWIAILWRVYTKNISLPEKIVLEYGVDKKGDMDKLLSIIKPNVAVVTKIVPAHMAKDQFQSIEEITKEKGKLVQNAKKIAILNNDCKYLKNIKLNQNIENIIFGQDDKNDFQIKDLKEEKNGFSFSVKYQEKIYKFSLPIFGSFQYTSFLPAIVIGFQNNITPKQINDVFKKYELPAGRGRIFEGINKSKIWDSSYNASPVATEAMLETLKNIPAKRRLALLGNMNELGKFSANFHKEVGKKASEICDEIFFVGVEEKSFSVGVAKKKPLTIFPNAEIAGERLKDFLQAGDLILVKGSQNNVRLEKAIEKLLANKKDIKKLCRRSAEWKKI